MEAIKKLKACYCAAATEWDENAFGSCFTEDAVWDGDRFGHYEGRPAIEEEYVKVNGEWKLKALKLTPIIWSPFAQGWVQQRFM